MVMLALLCASKFGTAEINVALKWASEHLWGVPFILLLKKHYKYNHKVQYKITKSTQRAEIKICLS